jgi:hypothetical protein
MRRFSAELLLIFFAGCDIEGTVGLAFDPAQWTPRWVDLQFAPHRNVDVLFVVDDSANMAAKQQALVAAVDQFTQHLDAGRRFHFGVITTDLGAGRTSVGQCVAPGGDGILVTMGRAAPAGCLPPTSGRFIDWGSGGNNLPEGQSLAQTLGCLLSVGDRGCGFPQPLEATLRALTQPANEGFLRDDSLLVIAFVSDGDDCSAPADSPLFDPARVDLGPFDRYRCVNAGVECGNPPHPPQPGVLEDCAPHAGGGLYELARYRTFLFHSNLKRDPNDVRLALLAGPAAPFSVALDGNAQPSLQPSCNSTEGSISALPAVRLEALAGSSPRSVTTSLCAPGAGDFLLASVAVRLIASDPGAACLPAPLANSAQPECDVDENGSAVPDCAATAGATPCWQILDEPTCVAVYSPRDRRDEQLALALRPPPFPDIAVSGRCLVLDTRK